MELLKDANPFGFGFANALFTAAQSVFTEVLSNGIVFPPETIVQDWVEYLLSKFVHEEFNPLAALAKPVGSVVARELSVPSEFR
jgi:hypothetical protein